MVCPKRLIVFLKRFKVYIKYLTVYKTFVCTEAASLFWMHSYSERFCLFIIESLAYVQDIVFQKLCCLLNASIANNFEFWGYYKQTDVTFWLTFSSLFSQVTVTSATHTFPCSSLSSVVSIVLFRITSLESDSTSSMISSKLTQQRSSLANERLKIGRWHSLVIKLDIFFISCIGCENETLVPNNSEKNPVIASRLGSCVSFMFKLTWIIVDVIRFYFFFMQQC